MIRSLSVTLALALFGLQLVAVVAVVLSTYWTSERALLFHARNLLSDAGSNVIQHSKGFLSPARSAAEVSTALAENRIVRNEQRALLERLLFRQLRAAPQFAGAYYGDEDGNFIFVRRDGDSGFETKIVKRDGADRSTQLITRTPDYDQIGMEPDPDDTFDPRARVWYEMAKETRQTIWTEPYIFFTAQTPGITAAAPVIDRDGALQGVVGVDIEIASISEFLAELKIGALGSAFILDQNRDVIAHPDVALLKTEGEDGNLRFPNISEIEDPLARAAFGSRTSALPMPDDGPLHATFDYMGEDYVSVVMPFDVDDIPWTIVVYAPETDFIGPIRVNRNQNATIAFGVALLTGLLGLVIANRIARPVRAFAVRSSLISQGELDPTEPMPRTYRELDRANETLVSEISQRKRSEREYRLTFDLASRGMFHFDPGDGTILDVNDRFVEMLGRSRAALEGARISDLVHPEDAPLIDAALTNLRTSRAFGLETRFRDGGGHDVWTSLNAIFVKQDGARPRYAIATVDDITLARADGQKIETLSREVARFTRQNVAGELATGLAHELNQPLTAITQNVDSALHVSEKDGPDAPDQLRTLLTEIDQQAHHAADIIRALRSFVRKDDNAATDFDVRELLLQSARLVKTEARDHHVRIVIASGPPLPVRAVRLQVAQVAVNLLRNAIEALAESAAERREVLVTAFGDGDVVQVEIDDTGPGVPDEVALFTAFETTKSDGMGLGLMISRSLVEANGGTLTYARLPDGSRFTFTLRPAHDGR